MLEIFSRGILLILLAGLLSGCNLFSGKDGKYYQDDGPPKFRNGPRPSSVPNAIPINEPLSRSGNKPYTALGNRYVPMKDGRGYEKTGHASWYGRKYHGRTTSSGEVYDMFKMTAAHPTLPLPSYVFVRNLSNNKEVVVKVNDRGPFLANRIIDLSYMAAKKLGVVETGTAKVYVKTVYPNDSTNSIKTTKVKSTTYSSDTPTEQRYMLQAGSFASSGNASLLKARLESNGYKNTRIERITISNKLYFRVQIGPYDDPQTASQTAGNMQQLLRSPVTIVKY